MAGEFSVSGTNAAALFTLKLHRGEGMTLVAMNWKTGTPPANLAGFAIEYKEPGGNQFFALKNRLTFPGADDAANPNRLSTRLAPIQKFRWIHFPRNADLAGEFTYQVTPVFMDDQDVLTYGEPQTAAIQLSRETYPDQLNVTFTRGFVSSQSFVDFYEAKGPISKLLPSNAAKGLTFKPTHPQTDEALVWMGFEARQAILEVLDQAVADQTAQVHMVAYDLNEPNVVSRLEKLGSRLTIIIDDSDDHGKAASAENVAEQRLSAAKCKVKRQHMGGLQHNKMIVVESPDLKKVVCGSTNFSWRGFYVQSNNALVLEGATVIQPFLDAFNNYWNNQTPQLFGPTASAAQWLPLGLAGIDASVTFSPHAADNARLQAIADDIQDNTTSCLFYSLAFLYQTPGALQDAIRKVSKNNAIFVYGISDRKVGGIDLQKPNTNVSPVYASALAKGVPQPFKAEPSGGGGIRMHHKFVVVDFDKPSARVYLGSYNFSTAADTQNGENLLLIRDRRIAVSYMIEAVRIFDHYEFRVVQQEAAKTDKPFQLAKSPRKPEDKPWWDEDYTDPRKIRDRELFS